jgi:anaerobic selenocysteine-containing dehydrogenase
MQFFKSSDAPQLSSFAPELIVAKYIATRKNEPQHGPRVWLHPKDATLRLLVDGELAWVQGARGQQLATVEIDPSVAEHTCIIRDVAGVTLSEAVRVTKPDLDSPRRTTFA